MTIMLIRAPRSYSLKIYKEILSVVFLLTILKSLTFSSVVDKND